MAEVTLRPARAEECAALTAFCLRSKAHWGYDAEFMALCLPSLTVAEADLDAGSVVVAEARGRLLGMAEVTVAGELAELEKIFVAPEALGQGIGRLLMGWARASARAAGARRMRVLADPNAVPFYQRMGARFLHMAPSDAIPGRALPRMEITL